MIKNLICICNSFPPEVTPTAIRTGKILQNLPEEWKLQVITEVNNAYLSDGCGTIHYVKSWYPKLLITFILKLKLDKILEWFIFPDYKIFWLIPAIWHGLKIAKENKIDAIVVFMMPYSAGLVGIYLKWLLKCPLVLNFDDSLTCSDMHPIYPSRLHYYLTKWLENFYISQADQVIYVSDHNLNRLKKQLSLGNQNKLNLVRYGADTNEFLSIYSQINNNIDHRFSIVYIGEMNGWYDVLQLQEENKSLIKIAKNIYRWWIKLGKYETVKLDYKTSSPVFLGKAVKQVIAKCPDWEDKVSINIYGNQFNEQVVENVLNNQNLIDVVSVFGAIPHSEAIKIACQADLLFLTLPMRMDDSAGGRISAKTYEYLMSDRPILAAVSPGEN
ncbi:glycosyltransferase [Sphaerospermopsis aphanizomenoides BCCUSP55]|uniref:glycosyltransferase n=1 Tax=Sphaerospermopsis aphanizomenoides TaxID=459663 RepID=UPI001902D63B|nr:glycosyltransferase [Sphaerospermopsis aphanizomenoides]MBK1988974.1 glycosyltransferase [Sphaerospermopsis aphanizomenoides BCCUSP55]